LSSCPGHERAKESYGRRDKLLSVICLLNYCRVENPHIPFHCWATSRTVDWNKVFF